MYNGCDLSPEKFAEISGTVVEYLRVNGIAIPELTTGKCFNADDIAKLMINDDSFIEVKVESTKKVNANPVENALKYLSTRYSEYLRDKNTIPLIVKLNKDIQEDDEILVTALQIICEKIITDNQLRKYGICNTVMNTMRQCYRYHVQGS
jgi:hypothetical protein